MELYLNKHPERSFQNLRAQGRYNIISILLLAEHCMLVRDRYILRLNTVVDQRSNQETQVRIGFSYR